MARTESKSIQVHPSDEQNQIDLMQKFHWSLLGSQDVKTKDSHLEQRGDSIYSVTQTEHYIKLTFSRDIDLPHLAEIKTLENEFFSLPIPTDPALVPLGCFGGVVLAGLALLYGLGLAIYLLYYFLYYSPRKAEATATRENSDRRTAEILSEVERYG